jgi:hypothetical protein
MTAWLVVNDYDEYMKSNEEKEREERFGFVSRFEFWCHKKKARHDVFGSK